MTPRPKSVLFACVLAVCCCAPAGAQNRWTVDFENGAAISGYNDARIPGDTGTPFSFTDDLASDPAYFWRVRAEVRIAPKHELSLLVAPLAINASGSLDRPVSFMGETFPAGAPVTGRYVFNSYRLTYRYELVHGSPWRFALGVTAKIRDAEIRLSAPGQRAQKTNVGFVPLVSFKLDRPVGGGARLELSGDALAAPQGRAEDVFAGFLVPVGRKLWIKAGYRLLEGGAANDEVHTFAMIHYAAVGVVVRF
jgi:hypothetical protein